MRRQPRLRDLATMLKRCLAALAGVLLSLPASALDRVTLGLNWLADPEAGGFYQAQADGTYARIMGNYGLK